mgnify:CR=1 FL=1
MQNIQKNEGDNFGWWDCHPSFPDDCDNFETAFAQEVAEWKEANGLYETYADIGLNEWIDVRIEFQDEKAVLYINNQKSPSFIVTKMLETSKKGSVSLWVEIRYNKIF